MDASTAEGRLIALRKAVAMILSRLPEAEAAEFFAAALLQTGEEDPAALPETLDPVSAAIAAELSALDAEASRLRRGFD